MNINLEMIFNIRSHLSNHEIYKNNYLKSLIYVFSLFEVIYISFECEISDYI